MIVIPIHILSTNPISDVDDLENSSFIPFFADSLNCVLAGPDHDSAPLILTTAVVPALLMTCKSA